VRPGELISAELINQILAELESLETRVTALEGRSTTGTGDVAPVITSLVPPETQPMRVGQEIEVIGRNFGFSTGSHRVTVDGVPVMSFDTGKSSNERLVLNIPPIPDLTPTGRPVNLVVRVGDLSAQRRITVTSGVTTQRGTVTPSFVGVEPSVTGAPMTITPGATTPVSFRYTLHSNALFAANFLITPTISGIANQAEWQSRLVVLNSDRQQVTSRQILLNPDSDTTFFIQLTSVPALSAGTTADSIRLRVDASADGVTTGTEGPRAFPIGTPVPDEDSSIVQSSTLAEPATALSGTTVRLAPNTFVVITLNLRFTELSNPTTGDTYDLSALVSEAADWTADASPPKAILVRAVPFTAAAEYFVQTGAAPSNSGRAEFRIQRRGGPRRRTFSFTLNRA
jgi:hypothetical protein